MMNVSGLPKKDSWFHIVAIGTWSQEPIVKLPQPMIESWTLIPSPLQLSEEASWHLPHPWALLWFEMEVSSTGSHETALSSSGRTTGGCFGGFEEVDYWECVFEDSYP